MPTPVTRSKDQKATQNNARKPTAQELYQQTGKSVPAVNPTNAADSSVADTPLNSPSGYSKPDSPDEGDADEATAVLPRTVADGGDNEKDPNPNPVKDNPRM